MSWLRIDDGFTKHPKFEGWSPAKRWAWLEVMEYCARYDTGGRIPADLSLLPRSTTTQLLVDAETAGWIDRGGSENQPEEPPDTLWVHNWEEFNPSRGGSEEVGTRVKAALEDHPNATANEIVRIVGGQRKAVLQAIRRCRNGSLLVPGTGSGTGSDDGSGTGYARAFPTRPEGTKSFTPAAIKSPHICPECGHDCGRDWKLVEHLENVHGIKPEEDNA